MPMKSWDESGKGFSKNWDDQAETLKLEKGEPKQVRIVSKGFQPLYRHWIPFLKTKGSKSGGHVKWFPHDCQKWDVTTNDWTEDHCEACSRDLQPQEHAVCFVLDLDAIYAGKKDDALRIWIIGEREQRKIKGIDKVNKVKGEAYPVQSAKYGCSMYVTYDPEQSDKALRMQIQKGERVVIKRKGNEVRLKVPKDADCDEAGEWIAFDLYALDDGVIFPPDAADAERKFNAWKVDDAIKRINKERGNDDGEDEDEDEEEDKPKKRKKGKGKRAKGKKESPRSRKRRRDEEDDEEDDEPEEEDDEEDDEPEEDEDEEEAEDEPEEDEDEDDEPPPKKRKKGKGKKKKSNRDDEEEDDDEEEPRRRRKKKASKAKGKKKRGKRGRRRTSNDDDDDDDPAPRRKGKKKKCRGRLGEADTDDCTQCDQREACVEESTDEDD